MKFTHFDLTRSMDIQPIGVDKRTFKIIVSIASFENNLILRKSMNSPIITHSLSPLAVEPSPDGPAEAGLADSAEVFVQHHFVLNRRLLELSVVDVLSTRPEAARHHLLGCLDTPLGCLVLVSGLLLTRLIVHRAGLLIGLAFSLSLRLLYIELMGYCRCTASWLLDCECS